MNILLLNPTIQSGEPIVRAERCQSKLISGILPPIMLASIGAVLKQAQHDVSLFDAVVEKCSFEEMIQRILLKKPDWIIVQNTTPTLPDDLLLAQKIKQALPDTHITFFGLHATARPHDVLDQTAVDTAVMGEPEITCRELAQVLSRGDRALSSLSGLAFKEGEQVIINPPRTPVPDLDSLPFPERDLLRNQDYLIPTTREPYTIVKTSRGCPFACSFCTSPLFYGTTWRSRRPSEIYREMVEVFDKYAISNIALHSETFNVDSRQTLELCSLISAGAIRFQWMCNSRVDTMTESMAKAMKESGCWLVTVGLESGNDELLLRSGKKATVADARRTVGLLKREGIVVIAYFLIGLPGETTATAYETFKLALELDPDYAHFYVVTPFPGTALFDYAWQNGYLKSIDWTRYYHGVSDVLSYPWLSAERMNALSRQFYLRFYFRPTRIWKEIKRLRNGKELLGRISSMKELCRVWIWNR